MSESNGSNGSVPILTANQRARLAEMEEITNNVLLSRTDLWKRTQDKRRSLEDECGYPSDLSAEFYQTLFDSSEIGQRVVEVFPKESWQVQPGIYESEDPEERTPFEVAWDCVGKHLSGERSHFDGGEEGNPIWEYLLRADVLSGIGSYGVILIGLDDGKPLDQPVQMVQSTQRRLTYLRVFSEAHALIVEKNRSRSSPRFGKPTFYTLPLDDGTIQLSSVSGLSSQNTAQGMTRVHWTRVIHVADNLLGSETFGTARMFPVHRRLLDLQKLYGGSAEMYWQGARPGLSFETHPQLGGDVKINKDAMRDSIENYFNGLQRYLLNTGMSVNSLAPQVVDPTPQISVQIEAICIKLGIPVRIFKGSERGELASSQDDDAWNDRMKDRQTYYLSPKLIAPFVNRLVNVGVLPVPKIPFKIFWPDLTSRSDTEKAAKAVQMTQALVSYIGGNGESLIPPISFLSSPSFLGIDEAEAKEMLGERLAAVGGEPMTEDDQSVEEPQPGEDVLDGYDPIQEEEVTA